MNTSNITQSQNKQITIGHLSIAEPLQNRQHGYTYCYTFQEGKGEKETGKGYGSKKRGR